jgi:hypothetical protein
MQWREGKIIPRYNQAGVAKLAFIANPNYPGPTVATTSGGRGAPFLTAPIDRGGEIRCYMRDPDGHLIEVRQVVPRPDH